MCENRKDDQKQWVAWFDEVTIADIPRVGGKNASLGEMIRELAGKGVSVPYGFCTTAEAYRYYIRSNNLEEKLRKIFADLDVHNVGNWPSEANEQEI
jgi:pyruvate,water dikinase